MIRVGVAGCGYWGTKLLRNLAMVGGCRITAVADPRPDRLRVATSGHPGVTGLGNAIDMMMLPDLDAVVIATPPATHYELGLVGLERRLHVLVEKPMVTRAQDARELIQAANGYERVLMVDHTFLFTQAVAAMKDVLASGAIGPPRFIRAARHNLIGPRHATNLLWELSVHDVAILDHVLERQPREVLVTTGSNGESTELCLELFYGDGLKADLSASWFAAERVRRLEVEGSQARLVYDGSTHAGMLSVAANHAAAWRDSEKHVVGDQRQREPLLDMIGHFMDCIRHKTRPRCDGMSGLRVACVLDAAERSIASRRRCTL